MVRGLGGGGDLGELVVVKEKLEPVALMAFVMEGAKVRIAFFEIMGEILVKGVESKGAGIFGKINLELIFAFIEGIQD